MIGNNCCFYINKQKDVKTILITGATGFLGSHIAEELVNNGYTVVAMKRKNSNLWRCEGFKDSIHWIDCDDLIEVEDSILEYRPDTLIHAAWGGVKANDRENWVEQEKNLQFLVELLELSKKTTISRIIAIGSQAEYGFFEGSVNEDYPCDPTSAYGAVKVSASVLLKSFAEQNKIDWHWIRIFSVFGPREEKNWLIPATIHNLLENKEMNLTPCEQRYDYLYVKDFANGILRIVNSAQNNSGIYNMSSGNSIKLKEILSFLESQLSAKSKLLHIGAQPYRPNQVMHMEGNSDKFFRTYNFKPYFEIFESLKLTIIYYKTIYNV
jgi:UDP-glucose 4-epimerase